MEKKKNRFKKPIFLLMALMLAITTFILPIDYTKAVGSIDVTPSQSKPMTSGGESAWNDGRRTYRDGSFNFYIQRDGVTSSKITIKLTRGSAPGWNKQIYNATSYTATISSSKNSDNVTFSNGKKTMTVTTKKASDGTYTVMNFPLKFTKPAHYVYSDSSCKKASNISGRFNFKNFHANDEGSNTINTTAMKTHYTSGKTMSINIQANTAVVGVRTTWTDSKGAVYRAYNSAAILNLKRNKYNLNIGHIADIGSKEITFKAASKYSTYNCCSTVTLTSSMANQAPNGFTARTPLGTVSMGTAAKTKYIYYDPVTYSITYDVGEGTLDSSYPKTYNVLTSVNLNSYPKPTKEGYDFIGWELNGKETTGVNLGINNSTLTASNLVSEMKKRQTGNITFTAKWTGSTYTVRFDPNGGSGTMKDQKFVYGQEQNLTKNTFTNGSSTFKYWNTKPDGTGTTYKDGEAVKNLTTKSNGVVTLYAQWESNEPPVITAPILNDKDGNEVDPFMKDDKVVIQKGDKFTALNFATASDPEDGDVTKSLVVLENIPLKDGKASEAGIFNVKYRASDKWGLTAEKTIKVQVNDPPEVISYDRYFFTNQTIDNDRLLEQVMIDDLEDGFVKPTDCKVVSIKKDDATVSSVTTNEEGVFTVTVKATDSLKGTNTGSFIVHIVEDIQITNSKFKAYPRFIDKDSINTLEPNSIWRQDISYFNALVQSLNNTTPIYEYEL